jgi:hypothetical protein
MWWPLKMRPMRWPTSYFDKFKRVAPALKAIYDVIGSRGLVRVRRLSSITRVPWRKVMGVPSQPWHAARYVAFATSSHDGIRKKLAAAVLSQKSPASLGQSGVE